MIHINILNLSSNSTQIDISVETNVGDIIESAVLWTDKTFKDYTKSISLNSYLTQTGNKEVFSVPISSVGEGVIYFIEFTSSNNNTVEECSSCNDDQLIGIAGDLNKYKDCLLDKLLPIDYLNQNSDDKLNIENSINIKLTLDALCTSIQFGYYDQILDLIKVLDKLCSASSGCNECETLVEPSLRTGLNYGILNNNLILR